MTTTLNQLASSTASLLNQPFTHELKERLIDSYKQLIAERIRHSVERHGIDETLKLSYVQSMKVLNNAGIEIPNFYNLYDENNPSNTEELLKSYSFITANKVFDPIRISNESIYTFVGTKDYSRSFPYKNPSEFKYTASFFPTSRPVSYSRDNGIIILRCHDIFKLPLIPEIKIEGIFYEPEKVLTYLLNDDGIDVAIPLPHDVISGITHQLLRNEFGIIRNQDIEVKIYDKKQEIQ